MMTGNNNRIAKLQVRSMGRAFTSSDMVVVPITDASGLEVELKLSLEAAHQLAADMKMTLLCLALARGPQFITMPKAPVALDVHSWSAGWSDRNQSLILRLEGESGEVVDARFSSSSINEVAEHVMACKH